MVSLTKRQRSIIEHLINCDDYVTLLEIATKFNVSKKTIQNDLSNIELFLNENNITLIKKQGLGIFLKANKSILDKIDVSNTYLSKEERINNIVVYLLGHNNTTYKQIADSLKVSRQTVINDFNDVINKLESLNIKVEINKSKGIKLIGKEEDIRDAYINNCLNTDFIYDDRSNKLLEELKDKYNLRFSNCNYIISVISFLFKRETKLNRKVKRNIDNEEYYKIINSYFNNENESNYLGNLLLNERLNEISKIDKKDKEAIEISEYLINGLVKFEPIKNKDKLEEFKKGLIEHIHCALYRIRNKQTISNDLLDVIKYTMPLMYAYTTKRLSYIEDKYNIEFNDVETSFIAMYLASIYEENKDNEKLRILVVCSYGLASSSILKNRIISKIPNIEIIGPIMIDDIKKVDNYDLILSTSPINIDDKPIVIINPLLNNDDVMNINNKIDEYSFKKRCESLIEVDDKKEIHKLKEYIKDDDIQIVDSLTTWQEAIRQASKPLLDKKLIEESYILEMINAVNKYGTYMVLSEGTAYVHAGKEDGIKENCTSLLVSKKPIKFGDTNTKLIYNIVVLGIKDDNSNMLNVVYILNNKNNIKKLKDKNISIEIIKELSN